MIRIRIASLLLLAATAAVACGGRAPEAAADEPPAPSVFLDGSKVGGVEVTYDGLEPDRVERLEAYEGPRLIREGVESKLAAVGNLDPAGALDVTIELDKFRLRSSASAFWWGAAAGVDQIIVTVRVSKNGEEVKSFSTNTSTVLGGIAYAGGGRRMQRLTDSLAERIVARL